MAVAGLPTKKKTKEKVNTTALGNAVKETAAKNTTVERNPSGISNAGGNIYTQSPFNVGAMTNVPATGGVNNTSNRVSGSTYSPTYGNYTIGSEKGQQQAFNMPIGSTYRASDGALWKKENDGSITVDYNGTITPNAYTMPDQGVLAQQQMAAGLPWQYLQNTGVARNAKIANDPTLAQYANDAVAQQIQNYINRNIREQNQPDVSGQELYTYFKDSKPTYEERYDPKIQALLNKIINREGFSYNAEDDPLYQQYESMMRREGDRAMQETLAEAAAGAGGMNSYAVTAAQQANNYYNAQLGDKIPELEQLAYQMWLAEVDRDVQNLGLINQMSDKDYGRYRDLVGDWNSDRNFGYGMYRDSVADGQWNAQFDYNAMTGDRDFNYGVSNDAYNRNQAAEDKTYAKAQADKEEALNMVEWLLGNGVSFDGIGTDLIRRAGLTDAQVKEMIAKRDSGNFKKASSGNGGGGSGGSGEYGGGGTPIEGDSVEWTKAAYDLGLPAAISQDVIADLVEAGAVVINGDSAYWTDGWNSGNYAAKLKLIY